MQRILPESQNVCMQHVVIDFDNTSKSQLLSFPAVQCTWNLLHLIFKCQEWLPAGITIWSFSKRCKKTQQWVFHPQAQEYVVVIPIMYKDSLSWADCVDGLIQIVKQTNRMQTLPIEAIAGKTHLVGHNAASNRIDTVWLVSNHVDLDTNRTGS